MTRTGNGGQGGSTCRWWERTGKRLGLSVLPGRPALDLFNQDGRLCLALAAAQGQTGLTLLDDNHVPRAELEMTAGGPRLRLPDAGGKVAFAAP